MKTLLENVDAASATAEVLKKAVGKRVFH